MTSTPRKTSIGPRSAAEGAIVSVADKRSLLAGHYIFKGVAPGTLARIADLGVTLELKAGEQLFGKGDEGDGLYGVFSGKVRISTRAPSGREVIISVFEPGDVFGEIALLDGLPRTRRRHCPRGLPAAEDRQAGLPAPAGARARSSASICWSCSASACAGPRKLIEDAVFLGLPARLAKRLLGLAIAYGRDEAEGTVIALKLSQTDLGHMLGTSRESINKQLQDWARAGWIKLGRQRVTVCDRAALQEIVAQGHGKRCLRRHRGASHLAVPLVRDDMTETMIERTTSRWSGVAALAILVGACTTHGPPEARLSSETECYVSISPVDCRRSNARAGGYPHHAAPRMTQAAVLGKSSPGCQRCCCCSPAARSSAPTFPRVPRSTGSNA